MCYREQDSKTLSKVLAQAEQNRQKPIKIAICDRGYRGRQTKIIIPNRAKKEDSDYQKKKRRALCKSVSLR